LLNKEGIAISVERLYEIYWGGSDEVTKLLEKFHQVYMQVLTTKKIFRSTAVPVLSVWWSQFSTFSPTHAVVPLARWGIW